MAVMNGLPSSWCPLTGIVHTAAEPSAMTASGSTADMARSSGIGRDMPTTCLAVHGDGVTAFTILPSAASTLIGASDPALLGTSGLIRLRSVNVVYAWV